MSIFRKNRLVIATAVYWMLLVYILAALIFWFIELQRQNQQMSSYREQELKTDEPGFHQKWEAIREEKRLKTAQYIGEGASFLLVILIGAIFLYRAVMLQIRIQLQQQHFMMAVTHELKTPIAITKLNLETLLKHKLEEDKQRKMIQSALEETNRLNSITNNILVSAQLEGGRYLMAQDELDLSGLVLASVNDYRNRFAERSWKIDIEPELAVRGDALLLQILVNNLIENAIKYSPRDSVVQVVLSKKADQMILQVIDEGRGIPDNEKSRVFRRFYRIGNEETRIARGTGLGLYLCRKIAADHRANILVSDNAPKGTIFTVEFKAENS